MPGFCQGRETRSQAKAAPAADSGNHGAGECGAMTKDTHITVRRYLPMTYPGPLRYKDEKISKSELALHRKLRKASKAKGWPKTTFLDRKAVVCDRRCESS